MDKTKNRKQKWETRWPLGSELFAEKEASIETRPRKKCSKNANEIFRTEFGEFY